jgi:hypothetical protein
MSVLDQMLADCLSYDSRRRELISRCLQLLDPLRQYDRPA